MKTPQTLQQAIVYYNEDANCHEFMVSVRWPSGQVACPTCGSLRVHYMEKAKAWKCYEKHPSPKFTLKTGTIFEDSPLKLSKWLAAVWLLTNAKNGVSSHELSRAIGVTQKTAWFMLHRIRLAMKSGSFLVDGLVEVDETFIGGKAGNMHKSVKARKVTGTGGKDKAMVVGVLKRGGKVQAAVVTSRKKDTLQAHVRQHVSTGAQLFTDALKSYEGLDEEYLHEVINHAVEYVQGHIHTNGIENFWSLLKRTLKGTYVQVDPFHLQAYLDEQMLRFNERGGTDSDRFQGVVGTTTGRRVTYRQLIGKDEV